MLTDHVPRTEYASKNKKSNICILYLYKVPAKEERTPDIFLILSGLDVSGWLELVGWYTILTATNPPCQRLFSCPSSTHTLYICSVCYITSTGTLSYS